MDLSFWHELFTRWINSIIRCLFSSFYLFLLVFIAHQKMADRAAAIWSLWKNTQSSDPPVMSCGSAAMLSLAGALQLIWVIGRPSAAVGPGTRAPVNVGMLLHVSAAAFLLHFGPVILSIDLANFYLFISFFLDIGMVGIWWWVRAIKNRYGRPGG